MKLSKLVNNQIQPLHKQSIAGAAIFGGASLLGAVGSGAFGAGSQSAANAANWNIANERNRLDERMFYDAMDASYAMQGKEFDFNSAEAQKARQWQEYMYKMDRAYNTPAAQRARYEQAGINPYFAMSNIANGSVTAPVGAGSAATGSAGSPPSAPSLSTPTMQAYDPTAAISIGMQGLQGAVNSYYDNSIKSEQSKNLALQNLTQLGRDRANMLKTLSDSKLSNAQREQINKQLGWIDKQMDATLRNLESNTDFANARNELTQMQTKATQLANDYQRAVNDFLPHLQGKQLEQMDASIKQSNASAYAQYQSGKLSIAQAATEAVNKIVREAESKDIKLDMKNKARLHYQTLKSMKLQQRLDAQKVKLGIPEEQYSEYLSKSASGRMLNSMYHNVQGLSPFGSLVK